MKTYAETQDKAPFDWNAFLAKESYTKTELKLAYELAKDWVTCACGNQCDIIERESDGIPVDTELIIKGGYFAEQISLMLAMYEHAKFDFFRQRAISTLHAIESRSQEIINDLKNKK